MERGVQQRCAGAMQTLQRTRSRQPLGQRAQLPHGARSF